MLWKIMLPGFLKGWDPILLSLGTVTALTATIIFLVGGLNKKGVVAFLGAFLGVLLTCIFSLIFSPPSMSEVIEKKPDISRKEIIASGFAVGRAVIGTMTTTLLLAYSGGYTALLMIFISQGLHLSSLININYIAAEILHTVIGSFGLVTVAPFTAIVGGLIYVRRR
jgi:uncharacterized membrane protein